MSTLENTRWLETAREIFEQSVAERDYSNARAVLADMVEHGFDREAHILEDQLKEIDQTI